MNDHLVFRQELSGLQQFFLESGCRTTEYDILYSTLHEAAGMTYSSASLGNIRRFGLYYDAFYLYWNFLRIQVRA